MMFGVFDLVVSGGLLAVVIGAGSWLIVAGKRAEDRDRQKSARLLREYFHEGGLVRALMARWKPQGRLTDRSGSSAIELPESVDRA
ncbi:hypothetical protein [Sphingomonas sp. PP-CC-3A-396]|uniref:hypothetical protein n=1 Tax=Sphingomonas sp. PP-CC-3A-396 TaxID=2135655 RepID=UPI00104819C6|nr:hypothetical protein [Sphingomonas sp. PP-CC-3A-396]